MPHLLGLQHNVSPERRAALRGIWSALVQWVTQSYWTGLKLGPNQLEPAVTPKSMLGHQSQQVSIATLPASPIGPWRRPTPPALLLFPSSFRWCVMPKKKTVRNEVMLLIYHAIDMKIIFSGNKVVILRLCFNMWRKKDGYGCSCSCTLWDVWKAAGGGGKPRSCSGCSSPLWQKVEEHLWILELFNISLCQKAADMSLPPVPPLGIFIPP